MTVSPTDKRPDCHIELNDGETTVKLVGVNALGKPDVTSIVAEPIDRNAIKTSQGENQYSDFSMPWMDIVQQDWSGGRGAKIFDEDKSRYFEGKPKQDSKQKRERK